MKKLFASLAMTAALVLSSSIALAEPAAVIKDGLCGITTPSGFFVSDKYHKTATYSETGVAILKCSVKIDDYMDGQFRDAGFTCGIFVPDVGFFFTTDTMLNISNSGNAKLTCKIKTNVTP